MPMDSHTADVQRRATSVVGKVENSAGFSTIYTGMVCEIEAMNAYRKLTLVGQGGGRSWHISWEGGEDLRDGDRVLWKGRKLKFEYAVDERDRVGGLVGPYQTGTLREEAI